MVVGSMLIFQGVGDDQPGHLHNLTAMKAVAFEDDLISLKKKKSRLQKTSKL